jgi:putative aminopeptidase FrvX
VDLKAHLKDLCAVAAPSGYEAPVRDVIRAAWTDWIDEFRVDGMGSLIAVKHGTGSAPRRKIMLCAHMDEIGLIVSEVRDGFIRTSTLGGIDYRVVLAQPVIVHGQRALPGVFGAAPPHMARSRKEYPQPEELWIDVGLPAADVAELVHVGDVITFDAPPVDLKGDRIAAKSLDNRVSVAAVSYCLYELSRRVHTWDVVAVASAQEETGASGATSAAYQVQPDIAIVLDGTFGKQKGTNEDESFLLGEGPTLSRGPNFHPLLFKALQETAKDEDIKVHIEVIPGNSHTDAWEVQVSRAGIPTALIGIPLTNMHTPSEVVDVRDVQRAGRWLATFITGLEPAFLDDIAYPMPNDKKEKDS